MTTPRTYRWRSGSDDHELQLVWVPGTDGAPYLFGRQPRQKPIDLPGFFIGTTSVTQALAQHVMQANPACYQSSRAPVENLSWHHLTCRDGFLDRINRSEILARVSEGDSKLRFRLPSETEWEYAARGGPAWRDGFIYSGSNDPDTVAWYGPRWTRSREIVCRLLGWRIAGSFPRRRPTHVVDVATKAPNQLGLYDMSGNVWEWCQDVCSDSLADVPADGSPYLGEGSERRLRGGCHHNWNLHCTVDWRYGIDADAHDGCLGFRLVLAPSR